jgi:hypothetical protein
VYVWNFLPYKVKNKKMKGHIPWTSWEKHAILMRETEGQRSAPLSKCLLYTHVLSAVWTLLLESHGSPMRLKSLQPPFMDKDPCTQTTLEMTRRANSDYWVSKSPALPTNLPRQAFFFPQPWRTKLCAIVCHSDPGGDEHVDCQALYLGDSDYLNLGWDSGMGCLRKCSK